MDASADEGKRMRKVVKDRLVSWVLQRPDANRFEGRANERDEKRAEVEERKELVKKMGDAMGIGW